jgi:RimJ/RimL family protein N-acetyltransferase
MYILGVSSLKVFDMDDRNIFNNDFHGKGYATEACRGLMDHAFRNMGAHRIIGKCCPENARPGR